MMPQGNLNKARTTMVKKDYAIKDVHENWKPKDTKNEFAERLSWYFFDKVTDIQSQCDEPGVRKHA